jgi:hypothetical protein
VTPIAQLKKIADSRLETLAMFVAMLTALGACCLLASGALVLTTLFKVSDYNSYAILCILGACFFAWIRQGVRNAYRRQLVRVKEVTALYDTERKTKGGGGLLI